MGFGANYGQGRGSQGQSYGLVTKNLKAGYTEKGTGIVYEKAGAKSVSPIQIIENIAELYAVAESNPTLEFLVNDYSGNNLNGYTGQEMASMFVKAGNIPSNIVFNENFVKLIPETPASKLSTAIPGPNKVHARPASEVKSKEDNSLNQPEKICKI
jgi:hypothetical protein